MSSISINNCVFMGRLTGEPEMRYTRSNKPVTTFRIAVSRRSSADVTDFIPCVTYGAQAEFVSQWFQKGTLAIVIGQLTSQAHRRTHHKFPLFSGGCLRCDSWRRSSRRHAGRPCGR